MHVGIPGDPEDPAGGAAFEGATHRSRRTLAAITLAALAVLAIAVLGRQIAPSTNVTTTDKTSLPSVAATPPAGAPVASSSTAPAASLAVAPPARDPAITPLPAVQAVAVAAGDAQLLPAGGSPVQLTVSLPDGWARASDAVFVKSGATPAVVSIGAWRLGNVNVFPCRWSSQAFVDGSLMRTAEGQATALSSWWGQDPEMPPNSNDRIAPIASLPDPTTIDGHRGWSVEVLIPIGFELDECDGGQLILWDATDGAARQALPGELARLWVVDVAGELIVIDAASLPGASPEDRAILQAVVDSIDIEP